MTDTVEVVRFSLSTKGSCPIERRAAGDKQSKD
jgi:hypothetical protein